MQELVLKRNQIAYALTNKYSGVFLKSPLCTILIDPTVETLQAIELKSVDLVLVTHEQKHHLDENAISRILRNYKKTTESFTPESRIVELINQSEQTSVVEKKNKKEDKEGVLVVCNPASGVLLKHLVPKGSLKVLEPGEELNYDMVNIRAFEGKRLEPTKTPLTYLITFENGIKIFHASDSLPTESMSKIGSDEKPDLLFVATGIDPGINEKIAAEVTARISPKLVVPYHGGEYQKYKKFEKYVRKISSNIRVDIRKIGEIGLYEL